MCMYYAHLLQICLCDLVYNSKKTNQNSIFSRPVERTQIKYVRFLLNCNALKCIQQFVRCACTMHTFCCHSYKFTFTIIPPTNSIYFLMFYRQHTIRVALFKLEYLYKYLSISQTLYLFMQSLLGSMGWKFEKCIL